MCKKTSIKNKRLLLLYLIPVEMLLGKKSTEFNSASRSHANRQIIEEIFTHPVA